MKLYKKRIEDYKTLVQGEYVKEASIQKAIKHCRGVITKQSNMRSSYFEFLYEQSMFIKKKWWLMQGTVLMALWFILRDFDGSEYMGRIIGVLATVFVVLIIPEFWKNRRNSAVEIEKASFYSLRQICAARILLFAIVDFIMLMVFFIITYHTVQISIYSMIINFLIPFNVSGCICFRLLYSKCPESEYIAVFGSMVWITIWTAVVVNNSLYYAIAKPVWIGLVMLSFGYLVFLIKKSQMNCEKIWRVYTDGIKI